MRLPVVSVVLPFRDAAGTLAVAARSIRDQTHTGFECLLVDNGSRDASRSVADRFAAEDERFRVVEAGGGLVGALNAGFEASRAPWVARMDADDVAVAERLQLQIAALAADPSLAVIGCGVRVFSDDGVGAGMRRYEAWQNRLTSPEQIRGALFVEAPLVHPSVIVSRDAWRAVGGYRDVDGPEDYDLWMRLILAGHRAAKVPQTLLRWRDSGRRLTRTDRRYSTERLFAMKLHYFPRAVAPGRPLQVWGAGPIGRGWAKALRSRGYPIVRFVDVDPRKIGRHLRDGRVEPPERLVPADGFVVVAVGSPGARENIEAHLCERGLRAWDDYLAVA